MNYMKLILKFKDENPKWDVKIPLWYKKKDKDNIRNYSNRDGGKKCLKTEVFNCFKE